MTNEFAISEATSLIREFNPGLADLFASRPFQREAIAYAFRRGFRKHSEYSFLVCQFVDRTVELDIANRAIGALE